MSNTRVMGKSSQCLIRSRRKAQRLWQQILPLEMVTEMVQSGCVAKSRILKPVSGSKEIRRQDVSWTIRWMAPRLKVFAGKKSKFFGHWNQEYCCNSTPFLIPPLGTFGHRPNMPKDPHALRAVYESTIHLNFRGTTLTNML